MESNSSDSGNVSKTIDETDPRLYFIPEDVCDTPYDIAYNYYSVYRDRYWICHRDKGLVVFVRNKNMSPQCNANAEMVAELLRKLYPWAVVTFKKLVLMPIDPNVEFRC